LVQPKTLQDAQEALGVEWSELPPKKRNVLAQ
jgi:hypothetical protein